MIKNGIFKLLTLKHPCENCVVNMTSVSCQSENVEQLPLYKKSIACRHMQINLGYLCFVSTFVFDYTWKINLNISFNKQVPLWKKMNVSDLGRFEQLFNHYHSQYRLCISNIIYSFSWTVTLELFQKRPILHQPNHILVYQNSHHQW